MKKILGLSSALFLIAMSATTPAFSADPTVHMSGYLIDETCASGNKFKPGALDYAKEHTRECSLQPGCSKFGFELYSDGKWYVFDGQGNKLARQVLTASKVSAGNYVTVDGTMSHGKIAVTQMKESKAP